MSEFVHLHVHSNYSMREGAARVEEIAEGAAGMGMESVALTDHDGMYGAVRFTLACRAAGIRPILGAEVEWGEGYHAVLLATNATGWANLCHLVTDMHVDERAQSLPPGKRPRTSFEEIARHSEGLLALSGCERGEVPWLASLGRLEAAGEALGRWLEVFGTDGFAVEVSNHLLEQDDSRNRRLLDLARRLGARVAATNNVHYPHREAAVLHEVLDCIRRIVPLDRSTAPRRNAEYFLKSPAAMAALHPEEAIAGAAWVAGRCTYELPLGEFHFPEPETAGESSTSLLARECWEGIRRRYPSVTREIGERLQYELRMIRRGGFCGYFLLVADIVRHAREALGLRCACRGSAAGSLVTYALGISDVDPIRHGLVFERFMNEHRREIPDIDLDFPSHRRDEVLRYILDTYGERTAMVAMMETFRARAALREVGKALGIPEPEVDLIAKAFPHISAGAIPEALEALPEVAEIGLRSSRLEALFDLASRLDGYPRHLALHPSGVILSDERLGDLMPMQRSFEGYLMSQYDKDDVEALGIAKLDVLGVRMLSAMSHALEEVTRVRGISADLDAIPLDDQETWELVRSSRTMGCFQIESPGQRELLGKFQPERFEDLIIDISLFRPGPVKSDMVRPYLERRHGFEPVTYPHPSLAPILAETKGVIVYHEQVMRVIAALTGCDLSTADALRRSLGGGLGDQDAASGGPDAGLGREVLAKAVARGWDPGAAERVWADVEEFAAFGFCKAHAAAFAVPTYQSAWLKAHYPAEFYSGLLTHDPGMYPRRAILSDARAHGVEILPVDVNRSGACYRAEPAESGMSLRLGLGDVKGISQAEIESITGGRPWRGLEDLVARAEVSRPVAEALVHCGAFDSLKGRRSRRELYWSIGEGWDRRERVRAEQVCFDLNGPEQVRLPGISEYSEREKVEAELEVLGLDASRHLISFFREKLEVLGWVPADRLPGVAGGRRVVVAGVKIATQTPPTRSGKRVVFLTLEDGTGQADVALFEEVQRKYARRVFDGWILAVRGTVRRTGARGVSVLGEEVIDLDKSGRDISKLWHSSPGSAGR